MKKIFTLFFFCIFCCNTIFAQTWVQKNNYLGTPKNRASAFSIPSLGKGYVVGGYDNTYQKDLYEYDTLSNNWTKKADFPGASTVTVSFSIDGKGYSGTGVGGGYTWENSFYEYDPVLDKWTKLPDFPGAARGYAVGFAVGGKGYIGGGFSGTPGSFISYTDFYCFDPVTNSWSSVAPYPGLGAALGAVGFATVNKGYVGTGSSLDNNGAQTVHNDFYEYDPSTNSWTPKANFAGGARGEATGIGTCDKGYIGLGYAAPHTSFTNDFWQYNPDTDQWKKIQNYGGTARAYAAGFALGKFIYTGIGQDAVSNKNDFWVFHQPVVAGFTIASGSTTSVCSGSSVAFNDTSNFIATGWKWNFPGGTPSGSTLKNPVIQYNVSGIYDVTLTAYGLCDSATSTLVNYIQVNSFLPLSLKDTSICPGVSVLLNPAGSTSLSYSWSPSLGLNCTTCSTPTATPTVSTTYTVITSNGNCNDSAQIKVSVGSGNFNGGIISALRDTVCSGTPASLSVTGSSGTIQWESSLTGNNFTVLSANNTTYIDILPQTTFFRVVAGNGFCADTSDVFKLVVTPSPIADYSYTKNKLDVIFNSSISFDAKFFDWDFGDGSPVIHLANPTHTFSTYGTYHVCLTVFNGSNCSFTTCRDIDVVLGIAAIKQANDWKIYPSPVTDLLSIESENQNLQIELIEMYDVLGKKVFTQNFHSGLKEVLQINVTTLPKGIYYLKIKTNENTFVRRVAKQ